MKQLTEKGFKITQVIFGNTTLVNPITKMIVEAERNEDTGQYEWYLFDESETLLYIGYSSSAVANYLNEMETVK